MLNAQRGQTLPFWLISLVVILSMSFFVYSFFNVVQWNMHAQNAADSAAATVTSPTTNVLNQETTMLYAAAVDEYRLRYLNQAMLNKINMIDCPNTSTCAKQYAAIGVEYHQALIAYQDMWQTIQQANNYTTGGQVAADEKAAAKLAESGVFDPAFANNGYTVLDYGVVSSARGQSKHGIRQTDVIACKTVSIFAPALMGLANGLTYKAVGRSAMISVAYPAVAPPPASPSPMPTGYSQYFSPGAVTNPDTGLPYQPVEDPTNTGTAYNLVDYSHLTLGLSWFTSQAIPPYHTPTAGAYTCAP